MKKLDLTSLKKVLTSSQKAFENIEANQHTPRANEGNLFGVATGYHLASSEIRLFYIHNSGFGN